jgi:hypothetical protein
VQADQILLSRFPAYSHLYILAAGKLGFSRFLSLHLLPSTSARAYRATRQFLMPAEQPTVVSLYLLPVPVPPE